MNIEFVVWIIDQLAAMIEPLRNSTATEQSFSMYMKRFGWLLDPTSFTVTDVTATIDIANDLATVATDFATLLATTGNEPDLSVLVTLVDSLKRIVNDIRKINPAAPPAQISAGLWADVAPQLADDLLLQYLEQFHPTLYGVLLMMGGVSEKSIRMAGVANRVDYVERTVDFGGMLRGIENPAELIRKTFGWTPPDKLDVERLLASLGKGLALTSLPAQVNPAKPALADQYFAPANPGRAQALELDVQVVRAEADDGSVLFEAILSFLPIPPDPASLAGPNGVVVTLSIDSAAAGAPLDADWPFDIELQEQFQSTDGIRLELHPGVVRVTIGGNATMNASASIEPASTKPQLLVGTWGSNALLLGHWKAQLGVQGSLAAPDVRLGLSLGQLELVIDAADSDGFIKHFLGSDPASITTDLELLWSSRTGFGFKGQAQLEAIIPVHLSLLDVIVLDSIYLAVRVSSSSATSIQIAVSGGLKLGPVAATVDRIGVEVKLNPLPVGTSGPLGNIGAGFGFKAPNGLGLRIDAGAVVGGGYIFCDPDKGQYAGILELSVEAVQVKIIGILNTTLPGGQSGFSLLLIVSAEFEPIQLAFGFTLNGVGGLAGINRTMVLDALRTGLKHHTLNSILFPKEPIKHAQQIISDLQTVFPPQQNRYIFGPMVELGWGVPSLIIAELGIVLELPAPIRLAILGQMTAAIPEKKTAVVLIHLDVLGTIEFEKKFLSIDATLYDSRVTTFTLLGDMALRMVWGDNANFALSVGGLHPKFQPPPAFPSLTRLTLSMGSGDNPRLSCNAYFAVTSNTLQFGAGMSLYASAAGFTLEGHLGFDALFVIAPHFHFSVEISGSVDLKQGNSTLMSLNLDLLLDGPNPFHASGSVSLHILFFTVSVGFDATWGDSTQVSLPGKDPTPKLLEALNDARSWNASMPSDAERAASLVAPAPDNKTVVIHPLGKLGVTQKVLPLGFHMTRFGSAAPIGVDQFDISDVTLNGQSMLKTDYTMIPQNFAPGQFQDLSEDAKLSRPSFEPHPAGVQLTSDTVATGAVTTLDVEYETILVDDPLLPGTSVGKYAVDSNAFLAQAGQGAAQFSELRNSGKRKFLDPAAPVGTVRLGHVTYTVTSKKDLTVRGDISGDGSFASVQQSMDAYVRQNPAEREDLQVTPSHQTLRV